MTQYDERSLQDFLIDIDCLGQLDAWTDDFNILDILKITHAEIRHSNILAWIFDPNENHGLGDSFIKSFITAVAKKLDKEKTNIFDLLLQDYYSYQVYRESNHMDIVLLSREEKTVIIIENKIWANESPSQLDDYFEKSKIDYKNFAHILYVFLTPTGKGASNPDIWIPFSYGEIIGSLQSSMNGKNLRAEVELLIRNYIEIVRKNIMKEKDENLVRICNDIYNKHRVALRLIFENVVINNSFDHEIISDTLSQLDSERLIIFRNPNKLMFFTDEMNDYLPQLETESSSWDTKWIYYYWIERKEDVLIIHFELGGWNLPDSHNLRVNSLIKANKKKVEPFRYKRLYYKSEKLNLEDLENSIRDATRSLVVGALENERRLLTLAKRIDKGSQ